MHLNPIRARRQTSLDGCEDGAAAGAGGKSRRCSVTDTLLALLSLQLGW
jgi:hypothetical protein